MKGRGRGAMLGARANGGDGWKTASFSQTQPIERARNGKLGTTFASLLTGRDARFYGTRDACRYGAVASCARQNEDVGNAELEGMVSKVEPPATQVVMR